MLHHPEARHLQLRLELGQRAAVTLEEPVEQEASRRVGERLEHTVVVGHAAIIRDQTVTCQIPTPRHRIGGVTVTPETARWEALAAARTRGDVGEGIASVLAFLGRPEVISFAGGFPDPETFPRERIAALCRSSPARRAERVPVRADPGLAGPLDAFADRLERLQGRRPAEDELLITSGAIEALELIGKSFLDPGDTVVVEGPTYLGAIQAFRSFEAALVAVPLDAHGLEVDELERRLAAGLRPKLVYTIPDHQNPAGVSLAAERRGRSSSWHAATAS